MPSANLDAVAEAVCEATGLAFIARVDAGAFKETFHVIRRDGIHCALKVFKSGASSARVPREVDAMLKCSHPSIARLFDISAFRFGGQDYLILVEEFLAGGTLASRVSGRGLLAIEDALMIGGMLTHAVSHIASHGLVHRDLKPDNIMFRDDGCTPVIVDFGIARDLSETSLTPTWSMRGPGTPLFSSPEQLNNEKNLIDWRADQFSLGVVLSVATYGFHPYEEEGDRPDRVVDRVAARGRRPARFANAATRSGLTALVVMTEAWPVHRFRTPALLVQSWENQRGGA